MSQGSHRGSACAAGRNHAVLVGHRLAAGRGNCAVVVTARRFWGRSEFCTAFWCSLADGRWPMPGSSGTRQVLFLLADVAVAGCLALGSPQQVGAVLRAWSPVTAAASRSRGCRAKDRAQCRNPGLEPSLRIRDQLALRVSLAAIPIPVIHSVTGS